MPGDEAAGDAAAAMVLVDEHAFDLPDPVHDRHQSDAADRVARVQGDWPCLTVPRRREQVLGAVHRRAGAKVSMRSIVAFAPVRRGAVPSAAQ